MTYSGNYRLGDLFSSRREKGRAGLPTLSVTMNDGLVNRDDLDRKQETNLTPEEHLLVKPGDIAYNMMRMWQGAFGLSDREGLVSPAYVVLEPNADIDPLYASYLFKTQRMLYLFWAYSYGLTDDRLRLYFSDFAKIPAGIPSKKVQGQIAQVLSTWDQAINVAIRLISYSVKQKRGLLQKLLPMLRDHQPLPRNWEVVRLDELVSLNPSRPPRPDDGMVSFLPMAAVSEDGKVMKPQIREYNQVSAGHTAFRNGDILIAKITPCFENGKGALLDGLVNGIGFGSTEFHVLRPKNDLSARLVAYVVNSQEFRRRGASEMEGSAGQKRVGVDFIRTFKFACPISQQEQEHIAAVLDMADRMQSIYQDLQKVLSGERNFIGQRLLTGKQQPSFGEIANSCAAS